MKKATNDVNRFDTLIIGGGPAGATAAAILAEKGWRVLLLEKEKTAPYKVGESLIPYCYFPLKRIGMIDKLNVSDFQKKYSVQFAGTNGKISQPFYFFQHLDHAASTTWQVKRQQFDTMMLDNAREKGAEVLTGMNVREIIYEEDAVAGLRVRDGDGKLKEYYAPLTIDASGRNGFFQTRNGWRVPDEELKKVAIWTYYKGAKRDPGKDEGATTVAYIPEKGWFWYIPLADDRVSVGVVAEKDYLYNDGRDLEKIFQREIENNLWIKAHLSHGQPEGKYFVTADFSYRSRYSAADGVVLTGDAFAFLDPVFSSGMYFALLGGELAADAADAALQSKDFSAAAFTGYSEKFCKVIEAMRRLVYAFYDPGFNFRDLFKKYPELAADVTDCLIGNVDKDFTALFDAISEFADVPEFLPHGRPLLTRDQAEEITP